MKLTDEFFFNCDDTMSDIADTGWMVEEVREGDEDGEWEYYIVHDNPYGDDEDGDSDRSIGYWVNDEEIRKERDRKTNDDLDDKDYVDSFNNGDYVMWEGDVWVVKGYDRSSEQYRLEKPNQEELFKKQGYWTNTRGVDHEWAYASDMTKIKKPKIKTKQPSNKKKPTKKKLNITKEQFNRSRYFQRKYGKLEYVSESGDLYKTNKGKVLMFNESLQKDEHLYSVIVKKPGGWDGSFQVNAMSSDEALEKARARIGRGSKILRIEDIGEYKAFDADDYAGFNESEKNLAKESIDADPALVCPYCGGNNCEVSIGTDDLNFTYLDRLQGETFNVECWCNDCNKPYNVTVELNVKDVYPNEDADELSGDWA